jgi:undecaprenyl-diphosphatase
MLRRAAANLSRWTIALFATRRRPLRHLPWRPGQLALGTFAAIAVVTAAMLLADTGVTGIGKRLPVWVVIGFGEVTDFGKSGWFLWPSGILLVVVAAIASPALGRTSYLVLVSLAVRLGFVFLAIGIPSLVVSILKRLIGRGRPNRFDTAGPFDYLPFSWRVDFASLPSGHATTAFAVAVTLGALFPRARPLLWFYACVIALSRIIISAHYPSDVVAGAIIGSVGALLVRWWFTAQRLGFAVASDGKVRPMPGPSLSRIKMVAARPWAQ